MGHDDGAVSRMDRVEMVVNEDKGATSQSGHLENGRAGVVPQNPEPSEMDSELRRRIVRKLDFNVLPIVNRTFVCTVLGSTKADS
jgi:hypothetical protein